MATITVVGNLAADPDLQFTRSGQAVARFTVMENRRRRNDDGQWEDREPNVFRVQVWGELAQHVVESCSKGTRVQVTGSISTDRWVDQTTGTERTSQVIGADDVAVSLRWHIVQATKAPRTTEPARRDASPPVDGDLTP